MSPSKLASDLLERLQDIRSTTLKLCEPLEVEDFVIQSMADVSPTKWHLAHTTWFFEQFVLRRQVRSYREFDSRYAYLFNSYYESMGERQPRPERGLLSRPTLDEVFRYRAYVDEALFEYLGGNPSSEGLDVIEIGCHHEQQHQELLLMDIKHVFSKNPLNPKYQSEPFVREEARPLGWERFTGGLVEVGHDGDGFAYDNEQPKHKTYLRQFALSDRCITNAEYLEFVEDGGYDRHELWLSDGWSKVQSQGWRGPLYWRSVNGVRYEFTLHGLVPLPLECPVTHVSFYEADAYARWTGKRLPTEFEWEHGAGHSRAPEESFLDGERFHPSSASSGKGLRQLFGDVWEVTQSAYSPYPNFRAARGALGEYNAKFMCQQYVLRGGACVTPPGHLRVTYRNFYYPDQRWSFQGIRLASDIEDAPE